MTPVLAAPRSVVRRLRVVPAGPAGPSVRVRHFDGDGRTGAGHLAPVGGDALQKRTSRWGWS